MTASEIGGGIEVLPSAFYLPAGFRYYLAPGGEEKLNAAALRQQTAVTLTLYMVPEEWAERDPEAAGKLTEVRIGAD